ncbi:MAG TPA: 50S ribosomal protein L25 [Phycisphaerales bacterium]|nr:50S ribosomal protein L25 [Phycisphaerales bacterium]
MHENSPILTGERRERLGSRYAKRLRDGGKLPVVVYGHGKEPAAIAVDAKSTIKHIHEGERIFRLDVDGQQEIVLLRDVQFDYLGDGIIHCDMSRVDLDEVTHSHVRIVLKGDPVGLKKSGTLMMHPTTEITVECKLRDLPSVIEVNISELDEGKAVTASEIDLGPNVKLLSDPNDVLAQITHSAGEVAVGEEAEIEGGEAQPEVIAEKKDEEKSGE